MHAVDRCGLLLQLYRCLCLSVCLWICLYVFWRAKSRPILRTYYRWIEARISAIISPGKGHFGGEASQPIVMNKEYPALATVICYVAVAVRPFTVSTAATCNGSPRLRVTTR